MLSIHAVTREEGITAAPVGLSALCHKYGVKSVRAMIAAHYGQQTRSFHQDIETPSGTPLSGWIDLEIHGNGDYRVTFHMHCSSILGNFDFDLRAYLSGPGCPAFFFHHSGHISGVSDNDYPETGNSPLIAIYWKQLSQSATFTAAKDYQWGGITGTLDRLANDLINLRILDFAAGVAGSALGAVIGVTQEAIGWLNANLGPGGTIGVIAGAAVFVAAAALGATTATAVMMGTVAGVAAGAITAALIQSRPMRENELKLARSVFADTIPYDKVMLTNLAGLGGRAFTAPGVDGKIYCNLGAAYNNPADHAYPVNGELLIHELTHAWQIAHSSFVPGMVCSGIVTQVDHTFGDDVYKYGGAGTGWSDFNLEQQGSIVDQWFAGNGYPDSNQGAYPPMDNTVLATGACRNPYYVYIRDNILGA
jgi:hypothetical protein